LKNIFTKLQFVIHVEMKKVAIISVLMVFSVAAFSQGLTRANKPWKTLNPEPGYITINEFTTGFGLGGTLSPYSDRYFGLMSTHGQQVSDMFMAGLGTGALVYSDGIIIPLYADVRLRILPSIWTPYVSAVGGVLLNPSDFNKGSMVFINGSAGIRYSFSRSLAATLSAGLWIQEGNGRASFINVKAGVVYKFDL
jgi:hypothetical protein